MIWHPGLGIWTPPAGAPGERIILPDERATLPGRDSCVLVDEWPRKQQAMPYIDPYRFGVAPAVLPAPTAFWRMEEAANNDRVDTVGSLVLAVTGGTYSAVAGILGNSIHATSFSGDNTNCSDNAAISFGDNSYTIGVWAKCDDWTAIGPNFVFIKSSEYLLGYDTTDQTGFHFIVTKASGSPTRRRVQITTPSGGAWHCFVCGYDKDAAVIFLQQDGGTVNTTSVAGEALADTANGLSVCTQIGTNNISVDCLSFWNVALSDAEKALFYNSGSGVEYYSGAWH